MKAKVSQCTSSRASVCVDILSLEEAVSMAIEGTAGVGNAAPSGLLYMGHKVYTTSSIASFVQHFV